jgi:hypothetical protein
MTDIAALTKRAHDKGWEQGTADACNAILAYVRQTTFAAGDNIADVIQAAWNEGAISMDLLLPAEPLPPAPVPLDIAQPALTATTAKTIGFTGNSCTQCGSMRMQVAGHCEVCQECGTTTGCS